MISQSLGAGRHTGLEVSNDWIVIALVRSFAC